MRFLILAFIITAILAANMVTVSGLSASLTVAGPPTMPTLTLFNAPIDQGQSILFSANIVTGQGVPTYSYAYDIYAYNALDSANQLIANMLFTGNSYTSNSWLWTPSGNLYVGNSIFQANVTIVDSHLATVNSVLKSFGYNSALLTPTISISNAIIDAGQYVAISAYETGGTSPYTYNFIVFNSTDKTVIANQLGTGNTFVLQSNSLWIKNSPIEANVAVTDSAAIPVSANSMNTANLIINPALTPSNAPLASNALINQGQTEIITGTGLVGGMPPYTYNWLVSFNGGSYTQTASTQCDTPYGAVEANTPITCNFVTNIITLTGTYNYELQFEDNAPTPATINTVSSNIITLSPSNRGNVTINLNSNSITYLNYTDTNVIMGISSNTAAISNVILSNLTSSHQPPTNYSKILVFSFNVITSANISVTATIRYPCSIQASTITPFKLFSNDSWVPITPFSTQYVHTADGSVCTVSFTVPPDPTIGIFYKTYATTTATSSITIAPPGSSGGGGGGGGGGPSGPVVNQTSSSCYTITNIATLNTFNVTFIGEIFKVTENFISPNEAGITINRNNYTLSVGAISNIYNSSATVRLSAISYLPIEHTITLEICSSQIAFNPQTTFTYIPVYATVQRGHEILSQIDMQNLGGSPEYINLSVTNHTNLLSLSAKSLFVEPNQSISDELMLQANMSTPVGTYYIPIKIVSTTTASYTNTQTRYITLVVQNRTDGHPYVSSIISIMNYTDSASGIIQISSPSNNSVSNITLKTVMPISIAKNISEIIPYGLTNNKTIVNNSYVISWSISYIPAGQSVYAYFTILTSPPLSSIVKIGRSSPNCRITSAASSR